MNKRQKQFKISGIMALLLFVVFAVCVFIVLLNGANVYNRLVKRDRYTYDSRTAAQYIVTRIRQSDIADSIRIEDFYGSDTLVASETIEGETYETRVYFYDGYMMELYTPADSEIYPEYGTPLLEIESLEIEEKDDMINISVTSADGTADSFSLYARSGREVPK